MNHCRCRLFSLCILRVLCGCSHHLARHIAHQTFDAVTHSLTPTSCSAGPGPADLSTVAYGYTSSVDLASHPMAGLVGIALVGRQGTFPSNGTTPPAMPVPADADVTLPILVAIMNENQSPYLLRNSGSLEATADVDGSVVTFGNATAGADPASFVEGNLKHSFNGFMFCNMPELSVAVGQKVRVAMLNFGSESDLHGVVFSGQVIEGKPTNTSRAAFEIMLPGVAMTADLVPQESGRWPFACAVHDHVVAGMMGTLQVTPKAGSAAPPKAGRLWATLVALLIALMAIA